MKTTRCLSLFVLVVAPAVLTLTALRPSRALCADNSFFVKSLKGSFGCRTLAGFVNVLPAPYLPVNPPGFPFVSLSRAVFDGAGNLSITHQTNNVFAFFTCDLTGSGTYTVNSDGTGTITGTLVPVNGSDPNCTPANQSGLAGGTILSEILLIGPTINQLSIVDSNGLSIQCTKQ